MVKTTKRGSRKYARLRPEDHRPASTGRPITGILRGKNPYELLIEVGAKKITIFKSSIWRIKILS